MRRLIGFLRRNDGLTTIEWVVLCGVLLFAALGISTMITNGAGDLGNSVATQMSTAADDN